MAATYPKNGPHTQEEQTAGSKRLKCEHLAIGQAADLGPAPPSRVYSDDYSKKAPPGADLSDELSQFLGNPLGR